MQNAPVSNPNDYKVVSFHNSTDTRFTPDMGCMYDGRPINGVSGLPGIDAGETIILPYHVGHQLAINLAKISILKSSPTVDQAGIPTGVPLWDTTRLEAIKNSYIKDLYTEEKPYMMSETDKLMAKVEEYKSMVDKLIPKTENKENTVENTVKIEETTEKVAPQSYQDKAEVIAELTKRGIKFDARQNKANLEKLLA